MFDCDKQCTRRWQTFEFNNFIVSCAHFCIRSQKALALPVELMRSSAEALVIFLVSSYDRVVRSQQTGGNKFASRSELKLQQASDEYARMRLVNRCANRRCSSH